VSPAYLVILGGDAHRRERAVQEFIEEALGGSVAIASSTAVDSFHAGESRVEDALAAVRTLPMFEPKRVVVLRGVERLSAAERELLEAYLEDPASTALLLLCGEKLDKRVSLYRKASADDALVEFNPPRNQREGVAWIRDEAELLGLSIEPEAALALWDRVGADSSALAAELEKLCSYVWKPGEDKLRAGVGDVEALVGRSRTESIFALGDAVAEGDERAALSTLRSILAEESPFMVLGYLAGHLRRLVAVAWGADPASLGVPPFVARKLALQARRFTKARLVEAMLRIQECDAAIKSGELDGELALEILICKLAG